MQLLFVVISNFSHQQIALDIAYHHDSDNFDSDPKFFKVSCFGVALFLLCYSDVPSHSMTFYLSNYKLGWFGYVS